MSREAMKLALGKIKSARDCHPNAVDTLLFEAEAILETALTEDVPETNFGNMAEQPAREPLTFEEWLAKQHGDPEEIGFLQALRIAYIAGQDSITKGNT